MMLKTWVLALAGEGHRGHHGSLHRAGLCHDGVSTEYWEPGRGGWGRLLKETEYELRAAVGLIQELRMCKALKARGSWVHSVNGGWGWGGC